jgi:protein SDA1
VDRAPILDSESSGDENEGEKGRDLKNALKAVDEHKHSKKTRARARQTKRAKKAAKKKALGKSERAEPKFPAMQLLDDPHRLCDALLARARRQVDAFEQRVARLDLCSRVACTHRLQLVAFYSYMRRYLKPSQEQAPRLLALFAQACHELVPPDELVPIVRHVADAFVSDRNASEAMALGINALREVCGRCPAVLDEPEMLGLVRDLAAYTKHRDKSVVVAARGWINIVREHHPQLLQKKDRGRDKARSKATPLSFGASEASEQVPGEDLLRLYERGQLPEEFEDVVEACNDLEGGGDGWVDVSDGEDDCGNDGAEDAESDDDDDEDEDGWVDVDPAAGSDAESDAGSEEEEEEAPAARILSAEDFARIKLLKARADELKGGASNRGLLSGADIVPEAVKRRTTVEERKARQVLDREKFQLKTHAGGKTNAEKRRTKNFLMVQKKKSRMNGLKKRKLGSGKGGKQQLGRDKRKRRRL